MFCKTTQCSIWSVLKPWHHVSKSLWYTAVLWGIWLPANRRRCRAVADATHDPEHDDVSEIHRCSEPEVEDGAYAALVKTNRFHDHQDVHWERTLLKQCRRRRGRRSRAW